MPDWKHEIRRRLAGVKLEPAREAAIIEELVQYLEDCYAELLSSGATEAEAHQRTLAELRGSEFLARELRRMERQVPQEPIVLGTNRRTKMIADLWQDLRYGARMLRKTPGFTAVAVLTLALGIGACTAIFSLINAALLRALPFPDSDRLVVLWADNPALSLGSLSSPPANADVAAWRRHNESFAHLTAISPRTADLADGENPERVGAAGVTAGFFETLGVTPLVGRTLAPDEEATGAPPVVLISHGLWQRRFGGDAALVGKSISVNGDKRMVIGILPPEFDFPRGAEWPAFYPFPGRTEVWLPLGFRARDDGTGWSNWESRVERGLVVVARLKRDISLRQAQAEMDAFAVREANVHPDSHKGWSIKLAPLSRQVAGRSQKALLILFAAVGLLLLIACVNVANLLLARGVARQQELAVRAALGANRIRLLRQMGAECLLLASLGSGLGLLVAEACLKIFLALNPLTYSRLDEAALDLTALGFAAFIALLASVLFGFVPALQTSRFDLRGSLQEGSRGAEGAVRDRIRGWLVAAEVALALVLLTVAGLMVRSFWRVQAAPTGFRSDSVLAFDVQLPGARYPGEAPAAAFFQQLITRLESLPGVRGAGAISYLPLGGGENMGSFVIDGAPPVIPGSEPAAERRWVTPGYFATMGILIKRGRVFQLTDTDDHPQVVVINETLARFFGERDPVGQRIKVGGAWRTVVGVVSDVKSGSLEEEIRPQLYLPHAQWAWGEMTVVVQTDGDPLAQASAARSELKALDPLLPAAKIRTLKQVVSNATSVRRFNTALLAFFAVAALLLTMMGVYGVVAFLAGRRSREIGIRMALGAQSRDVLRLVLRQGMKPVAVGCIAGLAGSLAASWLVASQLYGVSPTDSLTLGGVMAVLLGAALLACWLPARRAARADPMEALRTE
jgi:putative ABC transport system permease protein